MLLPEVTALWAIWYRRPEERDELSFETVADISPALTINDP
jgi:hypothetical protein